MSKKPFFLALLLSLLMCLTNAHAIALKNSQNTPTLDFIKKESEAYAVETPFVLQTGQTTGYASIILDGTTYYFNPGTDALARILAGTPARNLVPTSQENAIFSYGANYYAFDIAKIPASTYRVIDGSEGDYAFSVPEINSENNITQKYYKISFIDEQDKIIFNNSAHVSWEETNSSDPSAIKIPLPNEKQAYFKYTYIQDTGRYIYASRQPSLNGPNINADFVNIHYVNGATSGNYNCDGRSACGGAMYNYYKTLSSLTGSFVNNYASSAMSEASGGAIYNLGRIENIIGDFIGNNVYTILDNASGGAIYSFDTTIDNIKGNFIANHASSISENKDISGGAIFNDNATIGNISGDFIGNYTDSVGSTSSGGAIFNDSSYSKINTITGNFIGNHSFSTEADAYGGAIYNYSGATIGNITGDFIGNYIYGLDRTYGGAIYNSGIINSITGDFIGNYSQSTTKIAYAGAIFNGGTASAKISYITGNFIGNYSVSGNVDAYGGAIFNNAQIDTLTGNFIQNYSQSNKSYAHGGAIFSNRTINNIVGNFSGNYASAHREAQGGAIYNEQIIKNINGSFVQNYAESKISSVSGGAIYNASGMTMNNIKADFIENHIKTEGTSSTAYGGAIYNNTSTKIDSLSGLFLRNYSFAKSSSTRGGAIYNNDQVIVENISGKFIGNYASSESFMSYGGAIFNNSATITKLEADFTENYVTSVSTDGYAGAIYNSSSSTIGNIIGNFEGNYITANSAYGGAIYNANSATIGNITGDFIRNYASSKTAAAFGGAIYSMGEMTLSTSASKKSILIENNKTITLANSANEVKKLNSINFGTAAAVLNINTIADSYVNIRDPMTSFNSINTMSNHGIVNKNGAGSLYLWGDNSQFGGIINIREGNFYTFFEEVPDMIDDPLGQRRNFSLQNATVNFLDNTTFRPMITANKIANINGGLTVGNDVNIRPYNISSLNVGEYNYDGNYTQFVGMENDFVKVDTTGATLVVVLKSDLKGYEGMGAAVDAYRKLSSLSMDERMIFDNIYYTGDVPDDIRDRFFEEIEVISGEDNIIYNDVYKTSIRQFSRQIYSRIQNKNCPNCGNSNGYSDEHFWFNVGKNFVDKDTKGNTLGYKYEPTSLALGYDHDIIPNALNMGLAFGYAYGDVKGKGKSIYNTAEIDEYMVSLYWKYKPLRAYTTGNVGGGYMNSKTKVRGSTIDARGTYQTRAGFANFEFGYDFGNACSVLEPFIGFEYAYIYNGSYTEKGFGARHFDSRGYNAIELPIGFRVSRNVVIDSYLLTPSIELAYARSLGDRSSEVNSYFVASPENPWRMRGASDSRDSLRSSLNLKINNIYSSFAFNFGYARDTRSDYSDDQLYLTIRYNF